MLPNARLLRARNARSSRPARLFLFSDGAYEISRPDGSMLEFAAFKEALTRAVPDGQSELDELLRFAREVHGAQLSRTTFRSSR